MDDLKTIARRIVADKLARRPASAETQWKWFRRACAENDPAKGMLATDAPPTWTDHQARAWKTPTIIGRLKFGKCPGHLALREFVLARDGGACQWCGATEDLVPDHVVSRRNGGAHHPENLRALCDPCNCARAGLVDARRAAE